MKKSWQCQRLWIHSVDSDRQVVRQSRERVGTASPLPVTGAQSLSQLTTWADMVLGAGPVEPHSAARLPARHR